MPETISSSEKLENLESEEHDVDPVIRAMYSLPGSDFTQEDVDRYEEGVEKFRINLQGKKRKEWGKKLSDVLRQNIYSDDQWVRRDSIRMCLYIPENQRLEFLKKGVRDYNYYVFKDSIKMSKHLSQDDLLSFILFVLDITVSDSSFSALYVVYMLQFLKNKDKKVEVLRQIQQYVDDGRIDSQFDKLNLEDWEHDLEPSIEIDKNVRKKEYSDVLKDVEHGLSSNDFGEIKKAAEKICDVPSDQELRLKKKLISIIKNFSNSDDQTVKLQSIYLINLVGNKGIVDKVMSFFRHGINDEQEESIDLDLEQSLKDLAKYSDLYKSFVPLKEGDDETKFVVRSKQNKTGPRTILLDKVPGTGKDEDLKIEDLESLKGKVIIRELPIYAVEAWKKAYESYGFWNSKGFDYVPIEPIVNISPNLKGIHVDVYTGVIQGPSVFRWKEKKDLSPKNTDHYLFSKKIDEQMESIKNALQELGISHGHIHEGNFVLLFYKDKEGNPDLTRCPRVYLIDFDEAVLTQ
ncbi:MAG: hypothetical protein PHQ18_02480 [Patescibacteria group bacterium]|nr:hypothetical protein [Patescibacteria group bacterium]